MECCSLFTDILAWFLLSSFALAFWLVLIWGPIKLLLTAAGFLIYRYTSDPQGAFEASQYVLQNLAHRFGGVFYTLNSKRVVCLFPARNLFLEVERTLLVRLTIHKEMGHGRKTWKKWLRSGEVLEDQMIGWIKTAELLAGPGYKLPVQSLHAEQRCAYCKEWLDIDQDCIRCFQCSAPHHLDCFKSNFGCAVFGCDLQRYSAARGSAGSTHDTKKNHIERDLRG